LFVRARLVDGSKVRPCVTVRPVELDVLRQPGAHQLSSPVGRFAATRHKSLLGRLAVEAAMGDEQVVDRCSKNEKPPTRKDRQERFCGSRTVRLRYIIVTCLL
jgi:hypothetical protein